MALFIALHLAQLALIVLAVRAFDSGRRKDGLRFAVLIALVTTGYWGAELLLPP